MIKLNLQNLLDNTKRRAFFTKFYHVLIVHALPKSQTHVTSDRITKPQTYVTPDRITKSQTHVTLDRITKSKTYISPDRITKSYSYWIEETSEMLKRFQKRRK